MACSILEKISGFEPTSEKTAVRYLKLVTIPSFCPFHFDPPLDAIGIVCHQSGLLSTDLHVIHYAGFVKTFN